MQALDDPEMELVAIAIRSGNVFGSLAASAGFCVSGGGTMRTPERTVAVTPGSFVVHPPGEVHEYENGPGRTMLFRVRYGGDMAARHCAWRGNPAWTQSAEDAEYYRRHPIS